MCVVRNHTPHRRPLEGAFQSAVVRYHGAHLEADRDRASGTRDSPELVPD